MAKDYVQINYAQAYHISAEALLLFEQVQKNSDPRAEYDGVKKFTTSHTPAENIAFFDAYEMANNEKSLNLKEIAKKISRPIDAEP